MSTIPDDLFEVFIECMFRIAYDKTYEHFNIIVTNIGSAI